VGITGDRSVDAPPTVTGPSEREIIAALVREYRSMDAASAHQVAALIDAESRARGVDPFLVAAVAAKESSFRRTATSHKGAMGLMQIRPFVGEDVANRFEIEWSGPEVLHDPETNIRLGTHYLVELIERFDGDMHLALAAYHRGPTRVAIRVAEGLPLRSRYAESVLSLQQDLSDRKRGATVADARASVVPTEG
jgi:soluble lytic murein transglycosylase